MRKPEKARSRDRSRRGSVAGRTPAPAHLRREAVKLPPEVKRAQPRQQRMYRAAMTREVHADLVGTLQTPNRAPKRAAPPQPLERLGVTAPIQTPKRERIEAPRKVQSPPERKAIKRTAELSLNDRPKCKTRPTETKGNGGSRSFVPWCNKT